MNSNLNCNTRINDNFIINNINYISFPKIDKEKKDVPSLFLSDRFLQWGISHGIIDEAGTLLNPNLFILPPLGEEEKKILMDFFSQEIEMNFSSGQEKYQKEVKFTVRDLLSFIVKELKKFEIDEIELIGSSVFWLLKDYFKRSSAFIFKEYSKETKETGPSLLDTLHKPFDVDIRLGSFTQSQLSNYLEAIFKYLVGRMEKGAFLNTTEYIQKNKGKYPFLRTEPIRFFEVFIKEEGLSKFKQVNDEVNSNILDIIGFGKSFRIELIAYVKLQKTSLCRYDALHLDIVDFLLNQQEDGFKISGHNQAQAFIDLFTNNLCLTDLSKTRARDVLILFSRIARIGGRCLQPCLDQLYSLYVKERPDLSGTKEDVQNIFYAHHHKTMEEARNYLWSICLFFSGRREINSKYLLDLWNSAALFDLVDSKESAFFACIHHLLNQKGCSFTFISSWMQMAAFINLSLFNGRGVNHQMLLTLHDGKPAIRFQNGSLFFYLPFDLQNALKEIENSLSFIPYELLEFLLPQQIKPNVQMKEEVAKLKIDLAIFEKAFALVGAKDDKIGPWFQALLLFYIPDRNQFIEFLQRESFPSIFLGSIQYYLDPKNIWKSLPALLEMHEEKIHLPSLAEGLLHSFVKENFRNDSLFFLIIDLLKGRISKVEITDFRDFIKKIIKHSVPYSLSFISVVENKIPFEELLKTYLVIFARIKNLENSAHLQLEIYRKIHRLLCTKPESIHSSKIIEPLKEIIFLMKKKVPEERVVYYDLSKRIFYFTKDIGLLNDAFEEIIQQEKLPKEFFINEWNTTFKKLVKELIKNNFNNTICFFGRLLLKNNIIQDAIELSFELLKSSHKDKGYSEIIIETITNFLSVDWKKSNLNHKEISRSYISTTQELLKESPEKLWLLYHSYIHSFLSEKESIKLNEREKLLDLFLNYLDAYLLCQNCPKEKMEDFFKHIQYFIQYGILKNLEFQKQVMKKIEEIYPLFISALGESKKWDIIYSLIEIAYEHRIRFNAASIEEYLKNSYISIPIKKNYAPIFHFLEGIIKNNKCSIELTKNYLEKLKSKKCIDKYWDLLETLINSEENARQFESFFYESLTIVNKENIPKAIIIFGRKYFKNPIYIEKLLKTIKQFGFYSLLMDFLIKGEEILMNIKDILVNEIFGDKVLIDNLFIFNPALLLKIYMIYTQHDLSLILDKISSISSKDNCLLEIATDYFLFINEQLCEEEKNQNWSKHISFVLQGYPSLKIEKQIQYIDIFLERVWVSDHRLQMIAMSDFIKFLDLLNKKNKVGENLLGKIYLISEKWIESYKATYDSIDKSLIVQLYSSIYSLENFENTSKNIQPNEEFHLLLNKILDVAQFFSNVNSNISFDIILMNMTQTVFLKEKTLKFFFELGSIEFYRKLFLHLNSLILNESNSNHLVFTWSTYSDCHLQFLEINAKNNFSEEWMNFPFEMMTELMKGLLKNPNLHNMVPLLEKTFYDMPMVSSKKFKNPSFIKHLKIFKLLISMLNVILSEKSNILILEQIKKDKEKLFDLIFSRIGKMNLSEFKNFKSDSYDEKQSYQSLFIHTELLFKNFLNFINIAWENNSEKQEKIKKIIAIQDLLFKEPSISIQSF